MKFRKSFVTNSSSSSYVCEICGNVESGYDAGPSEVGMIQCKNEHIFCDYHVTSIDKTPTREDVKKEILISLKSYQRSLDVEVERGNESQIKKYQEYVDRYKRDLETVYACEIDSDEWAELVDGYEFNYYLAASKCPICNFEILTNDDVRAYINKKHAIDNKTIEDEIKSQFTDYDAFCNFLMTK